ncbi:hypothetical protein [Paenibacillus sp. PAMC21692]|uniref:hypothetical protein n=1 Tax=Paenibacillus sp. PAMC21692 TaxID=2762320 RepID=UPI00164DC1AD|nr:hypothetical protein [Paenibacillus sp. PAMC21692]QNK54565.1 hypothetical protein H7F31_18060 [Paenibacillus sp. PAMC21692]
MAVDANKIALGPARVTFDFGGTSPVVFEQTQGGVVLTYEETTRDIPIDQLGTTAADVIITGRTASVAVPIAERDLEKLSKIIPGAVLVTDGADPTKQRVDVSAAVVARLFPFAKKVKIEPLDIYATPADTVILHKAAPQSNLNYTYSYDNELITNTTFRAFPDTAQDGLLISFGDPDADADATP